MSVQCYESRGWGIQFNGKNGNNTTVEKIQAMLELAPELKEDVNSWLEDSCIDIDDVEVSDYAEYDQDYCNGIPALIAQAMNEYYHSEFMCAESDEDGCLYLYMPCAMPWEQDEFTRNLSEDAFEDALRKFYNILYDEESDIGFVSIPNIG